MNQIDKDTSKIQRSFNIKKKTVNFSSKRGAVRNINHRSINLKDNTKSGGLSSPEEDNLIRELGYLGIKPDQIDNINVEDLEEEIKNMETIKESLLKESEHLRLQQQSYVRKFSEKIEYHEQIKRQVLKLDEELVEMGDTFKNKKDKFDDLEKEVIAKEQILEDIRKLSSIFMTLKSI